jgi:hypothetical protein
LPDFYDSLFNLLASLHDGTKPGYVREKATSLSNNELEALFRAFCFASKELFGKITLSSAQFKKAAEQAQRLTSIACTVEGFRTDITETICLMAKEGVDTTFMHKSIQEYYAASFIRHLENDELVKSVLDSIHTDNRVIQWAGELRFLEELGHSGYVRHVGIPQAEELLSYFGYSEKTRKIRSIRVQAFVKDVRAYVYITRTAQKILATRWIPETTTLSISRLHLDLMSQLNISLRRLPQLDPKAISYLKDNEVVRQELTSTIRSHKPAKDVVMECVEKFANATHLRLQKMKERQKSTSSSLLKLLELSK